MRGNHLAYAATQGGCISYPLVTFIAEIGFYIRFANYIESGLTAPQHRWATITELYEVVLRFGNNKSTPCH